MSDAADYEARGMPRWFKKHGYLATEEDKERCKPISSTEIDRQMREAVYQAIAREIFAERERQHATWGEQNHDPFKFLSILGEEFGEVCRATFEAESDGEWNLEKMKTTYRHELIQVAAVAMQMIEAFDRKVAALEQAK